MVNSKNEGKLYCTMGDHFVLSKNFWQSESVVNKNGILHICSDCVNDLFEKLYKKYKHKEDNFILDGDSIEFDTLTEHALKETCRYIDLRFSYDAYSALQTHITKLKSNDKKIYKIFGIYKSKLSSTVKNNVGNGTIYDLSDSVIIEKTSSNIDKTEEFLITDSIKNKWGFGYTNDQYEAFEKKYYFLRNNYSEVTAMHTEALLNYIRYKVKEEFAIANDNVAEAEKWNKMANQASTSAKINPNQLSKADLSEGLSTFSELSQAIEKEVDILRILPKFKFRPNDALDFNIWCYVNYDRDLRGMQPAEYYDIYKFYDERVESYIKQYGDPYDIFKDDPMLGNREKIIQFLLDEKQEFGDSDE